MDTLTYPPSSATQVNREPRVLRSQFGDGYAQEAADGINSDLETWEVVYGPLHATDTVGQQGSLALIEAFFKAQAGYKLFLWTPPPPYNTQKKFVCLRWPVTYERGLEVTIRATLQQRP